MVGKIVPKKFFRGVDLCSTGKYSYVVRSDLGCYMKTTSFSRGVDLEILSLHPSCRRGDHYIGHKDGLFYIIKGNCYRRVKNLTTDEDPVVSPLHPKCQGGDHYLSALHHFYIVYQSRGFYRRTRDLSDDKDGKEYSLHPNCKDGLYYFGNEEYYCFMRSHDQWGIQYLRNINFHEDLNFQTYSFHPNVINFLPGGLGVTKGSARGEWVCIKTISNDLQTPLDWKKTITKKTGYEKQRMSCIEHNWDVSTTVTPETGDLTALIARSQFSIMVEYCGCGVNTDEENWNEVIDAKETISITLQPHQKINIWTYQLCLGKEPVLFCGDMRILDTSNTPTDVPLPPAVN